MEKFQTVWSLRVCAVQSRVSHGQVLVVGWCLQLLCVECDLGVLPPKLSRQGLALHSLGLNRMQGPLLCPLVIL